MKIIKKLLREKIKIAVDIVADREHIVDIVDRHKLFCKVLSVAAGSLSSKTIFVKNTCIDVGDPRRVKLIEILTHDD